METSLIVHEGGKMDSPGHYNKEITDPKEIAEILRVALSHRWNFSYSVTTGRRITSHTTELVALQPETGTITVGSEVKYSGLQPGYPVTFRAQSGGISLQFDSRLIGGKGNALSNRLFSECRIEYPDRIRFNQLRKAVRVDANTLDDIHVTLFANDMRLKGKVQDISATGTKIRFDGNLSYQFKQSRIVTDCQMRLPDDTVIEARLKVLGFYFDRDRDLSYIRSYFLEMREENELKLEELINSALTRMSDQVVHF